MSKIFISYRREDSAGHAGRLYADLQRHLGRGSLFMDVAGSIAPGEDFTLAIERSVTGSDAFVAVIGRSWLRLLHDRNSSGAADDFVRTELAIALKSGVLVIPVLVGGASVPGKAELPEDLEALSRRHAVELSDSRWDFDVTKLLAALQPIVKPGRTMGARRLAVVASSLVVAAALALSVAWATGWLGGRETALPETSAQILPDVPLDAEPNASTEARSTTAAPTPPVIAAPPSNTAADRVNPAQRQRADDRTTAANVSPPQPDVVPQREEPETLADPPAAASSPPPVAQAETSASAFQPVATNVTSPQTTVGPTAPSPPPVAEPAGPDLAAERLQIQALLDQYVEAYSRMDETRLREIDPSFDGIPSASLLNSVTLTVSAVDIYIEPDGRTAELVADQHFTNDLKRGGGVRETEGSLTWSLRKRGNSWTVVGR